MNFSKICVIGLGYIGLPTACTFAKNGLKVAGVDINPDIIKTLLSGEIHIHEPGLLAYAREAILSHNLTVSISLEPADAFIISVPTPFYDDKKADLRAVRSAVESIVPHLRKGNLVVLESTSPPRTTIDVVVPILEKSGLSAGKDFYVAYSPERVLPGKILRELIENDRVIGGITPASAEAGRDLYAHFVKGRIVLTDATTAEMVKLMENTYRDVNIAIANEFSRLADRFGVDVWEAIDIANLHPRVKILNPGPGVGGHCISVDPWFFVETAPDLTKLILAARQVNDSQSDFVFDIIQRAVGNLDAKRVAVLGLAYKPDVDDLRESPAVEIAQKLVAAGASLIACEPYKPNAVIPGFEVVGSVETAVKDADVIVILVAHKQFLGIEARSLLKQTKARVLIDTVGAFRNQDWAAVGFRYWCLGVGCQPQSAELEMVELVK